MHKHLGSDKQENENTRDRIFGIIRRKTSGRELRTKYLKHWLI